MSRNFITEADQQGSNALSRIMIVATFVSAWVLTFMVAAWVLSGTANAEESGVSDISFNDADVAHILKQIKIAELHVQNGSTCADLVAILPNKKVPLGLRTVNGACNNLEPGQENFGKSDEEFASSLEKSYRSAQPLTQAMAPGDVVGEVTNYNQGDGRTVQDSTPRLISHLIVNQSTDNPAATIAAAENEDSSFVEPHFLTGSPMLEIPNVAVDEGLSAPFNAFMTFFGQFFDHGLDLVNKGGNGVVFTPLQEDDPLYRPGEMNNFMLLTRATLDAGMDGIIGTEDDVSGPINATTPHVDQQQTYGSHASAQVLLRHYTIQDGELQDTGRLLDGHGSDGELDSPDDGGLAKWATVKLQALEKFCIELDDFDGVNMPMLAADIYGNVILGAAGLPQLVVAGVGGAPATLVEGDCGTPPDATQAMRINHSFFLDVAHTANPTGHMGPLTADADSTVNPLTNMLADGRELRGLRAEPAAGEYDNELLEEHFACGDGRCNENIALTTIHHIFHHEHNRLASVAKRVILDEGNLDVVNEWMDTPITQAELDTWETLPFLVSSASLSEQAQTKAAIDLLGFDWNGSRIFQIARFGTENQYNRVVFDEFTPSLAGLKDVFEGFDSTQDPTITAEFAHTVYRFGHSMLTETMDRFDADFNVIGGEHLSLVEAFLNPCSFRQGDADCNPTMSPEEAAGAVIRGITRTRGNEIDEFVTSALQNNVYGLPLDLGAINIQRTRDTGVPGLNNARKMFFKQTQDYRLQPYKNWMDYADNLRHEASLVNFIAAYGTHVTLAGADQQVGTADDPYQTFAERRAMACAIVSAVAHSGSAFCTDNGWNAPALVDPFSFLVPVDALDFLFSQNAYANTEEGDSVTGVDLIDFWNGGLAEERMPFGGFLGSTHNYVFEKQAENLQNGDRMYYVARTGATGMNFFNELESNSFTALAMRSSDMGELGAGVLPINIFVTQNHYLDVNQAEQYNAYNYDEADAALADAEAALQAAIDAGAADTTAEVAAVDAAQMAVDAVDATADPEPEAELVALIIRDAARVTTAINIADPTRVVQYTGGDHVSIVGTDGPDTIIGGIGDDSLYGRAGDDRIEGGDGADLIEGGPGNDIITDLSGPDVIEGGAGNDAIASGNEEDVVFGDDGNDFIVNSSEFGEIFGGNGDDFILLGIFLDFVIAGAGDDWLEELGGGENIHAGDEAAVPEGGEPGVKGNDIFIAWAGNNDMDMENGDDIMVDGPGIERMEGQLGFDWASFQFDKEGVSVDLDFSIFLAPVLPPSNATIGNRYDRIEGMSGSAHADILKGTANEATEVPGNGLHNFELIDGLDDMVPVAERRDLPNDPVTGEELYGWDGGEIMLGGAGSDILISEGGDDIVDGDSALSVAIAVQTGEGEVLYQGMRDIQNQVFDGSISMDDVSASRIIADADEADADTDAAAFSGNFADYDIERDAGGSINDVFGGPLGDQGPDGYLEIVDTRPLAVNLVARKLGNDGRDLVRNVERLTFADQTIVLAAGIAGSGVSANSVATGQPTISSSEDEAGEDASVVEAIGAWEDGPSGYSHVAPAGDNRVLAVMCHVEANDPPTDCSTITYGGQALTEAVEALQNQGNAFAASAEIWILDEAGIAAAAGSQILATFTEPGNSPADTRRLSSQFFSGVDQDDPIGEIGTDGENANNTQTLSVTLSGGELDAGDMIIANETSRSDQTGQMNWNWQNGFIEIGEYSPGLNCDFAPYLCFSDAIKQADGTSETVTVTVLNNGVAALAVVSLNHVPGSEGTGGPQVLTASLEDVMDADNAGGIVDPEGADFVWQIQVELGSNGYSDIIRPLGTAGNGDPVGVNGDSLVVTDNEAGLAVRVQVFFQDDAGVIERVTSEPFQLEAPEGAVPNPNFATFLGNAGDVDGGAATFENRSAGGAVRVEIIVPNIPLALFANTGFSTPVVATDEQDVAAFQAIFTNAADEIVNSFGGQLVAQEDDITGVVSQTLGLVAFDLGAADVLGPPVLIDGPTTITIEVEGTIVATRIVNGDSSTAAGAAALTGFDVIDTIGGDEADEADTEETDEGDASVVVGTATADRRGRFNVTGSCNVGEQAAAAGATCRTRGDGSYRCRARNLTAGETVEVTCNGAAIAPDVDAAGVASIRGRVRLSGQCVVGQVPTASDDAVTCDLRGRSGRFRCDGTTTPNTVVTVNCN